MLTSEFSKNGLEAELRQIDLGRYAFARDKHARSLYLTQISRRITDGQFDFHGIKKKSIKKFFAYRTCKLGDELVIRRIATILRKTYRLKQSDRTTIVNQVKSLLEERTPKHVLRLDISSFYESIDCSQLSRKIDDERLLSSYTAGLMNKFFSCLKKVLPNGLPRGMGISAVLSELYLNNFDTKVRQIAGVYYYARYVDDIIIFASEDSDKIRTLVEQLLPPGMSLNQEKCKQYFIGCECAIACKHVRGHCPCIEKCNCKPDKTRSHDIEYVGYRFVIPRNIGDKKNQQKPVLEISTKKINRIKTRIVLSFLSHVKSNNFDLLCERVRFLAESNLIKTQNNKGRLKSGLRYNYPLILDGTKLKSLDLFLRQLIFSQKSPLGRKIRASMSDAERAELKKLSFVSGYNSMRSQRVPSTKAKQIRKCWKNA